jgi:hypothetical protein
MYHYLILLFMYTCISHDLLKECAVNMITKKIAQTYTFVIHKKYLENYVIDDLQLFPLDLTKIIIDYTVESFDIIFTNQSLLISAIIMLSYNDIEYYNNFFVDTTDNQYSLYNMYSCEYIKYVIQPLAENNNIVHRIGYNLFGFFNYYNNIFYKNAVNINNDSVIKFNYNTHDMVGFDESLNKKIKVEIVNQTVFDIMLCFTNALVSYIKLELKKH